MNSSSTTEWTTVLDAIEKDLLSDKVRPGDRLPTERALASTLKVHRSSVREALRVLEVLDLIRMQMGSGSTSGAVIVASPSGGMGALMRLHVAAQGFRVSDIVRTRLLFEGAVARDLAERSDEVDLGPLTELLDAMESPQLSQTEFLVLNAQFHLALAGRPAARSSQPLWLACADRLKQTCSKGRTVSPIGPRPRTGCARSTTTSS